MIALLTLLATPASAQVEVCLEPYSAIQLGTAIGNVENAFVDRDLYSAKDQLQLISERIVCLDEVVDRPVLARFARALAINYFFEQDEEQARRWHRLASLVDPNLRWQGTEFTSEHPLRSLLDTTPVPTLSRDDDHGLAPPKGGGVFMNGELLVVPDGFIDTPSLVQVFDKNQELVGAYWQDGMAFQQWVLDDEPGQEEEAPKWWTGDGPSSFAGVGVGSVASTPKPTRTRSGDGVSVVPLVASGGLIVVSGITYGLASMTAGTLSEQPTSEDLTRVRSTANALVLASGATLAAGVGVGVGGVLASGGAGVRVNVRF